MTTSNMTNTSNSEDVWFVDSSASNHMKSHEDLFLELRKPERPSYVETKDDTIQPIHHVGNVPFGEEGNQTCIKKVFHVLTTTKNLVLVGQIVEQVNVQVQFNEGGYFIEKEG